MKNGVIECSVCHSKLGLWPTTSTVLRAYNRHRSKMSSKFRALNVLLVVGDCIMIGLQPILVYMSKVDDKFNFSPVSVNFLTEATKVLFTIIMLLFQARRQKWEALALFLVGITMNQLRSLPEGPTGLGLPVATGAYLCTLLFVTMPTLASVYNEYVLKS